MTSMPSSPRHLPRGLLAVLLLAAALLPPALPAPAQAPANAVLRVKRVQDLQGWSFSNLRAGAKLADHPGGGVLVPCGLDTHFDRALSIRAEDYPTLVLDLAVLRTTHPAELVCMYWTPAGGAPGPDLMVGAPLATGHNGLLWIDLASHPLWTGRIGAIRIDPLLQEGDVVLRGVALLTTRAPMRGGLSGPVIVPEGSRDALPPEGAIPPGILLPTPPPGPPVHEWNFARARDALGWRFHDEDGAFEIKEKPVHLGREGAVLVCTAVDPQFRLEPLGLPASSVRVLVVEMQLRKLSTADPVPQLTVFWSKSPDMAYFPHDGLFVRANVGAGMQTIAIDLSQAPGWNGNITGLRIDPCDNAPVEATIRRIALY